MVPIRLDIFTAIILLGTVQGLFLSVFFFLKRREAGLANVILGGLVLTFTIFSVDIFLGYSGYMAQLPHSVDFSEPLNFVMGPLVFLYTVVLISGQEKLQRNQYLHFLVAFFYLVYCFFFFLQPVDYKFNAYIDAYYPDFPRRSVPTSWDEDPLHIKKHVDVLQFLHTGIYVFFSVKMLGAAQSLSSVSQRVQDIRWLKIVLYGFCLGMGIIFLIKFVFFERDLGEYLIALTLMLMLYSFSFYVMSNSRFFSRKPLASKGKYEKSVFPEARVAEAVSNLRQLMETDQPYLSPNFSLSELAEKSGLSSHAVSQLLNAHIQQNFYEFTASYRVEAAKALLADPSNLSKSIEVIAEEVGYFSKSSFNTAFKKQTGTTPAKFRKEALGLKS